jgi:hypothetical protein
LSNPEFDPQTGWRLYYKDRETLLYYIEFTVNKKKYYKIGITTQGLEKRFAGESHSYKVLWAKLYKSGATAYAKEQGILRKYQKYRYASYDILKSGNSELFTKNIMKDGLCQKRKS